MIIAVKMRREVEKRGRWQEPRHWPVQRHTKWLCQSNISLHPIWPIIRVSPWAGDGAYGGWTGGGGGRDKSTCYWRKMHPLCCWLVLKIVDILSSGVNGASDKEVLGEQISALLMWEDAKRLFARGVISRCSKALMPVASHHHLNLSITPLLCSPIVSPLHAAQSQFLAVLNRESRLQKASGNCVYWIGEPGQR